MKVAFTTLGCRTNQHDTAEMQTLLEQDGFSVVPPEERADIYVVNTCTVTARSDYRSRLAVKKSLGLNEKALVVFTGCYAQNQPSEAMNISGLGLLLGNADKLQVVSAIRKAVDRPARDTQTSKPLVQMSDIRGKRSFTPLPVTGIQGKTKAFIKVQTGCDEICSFCTVVRARGRSISDQRANIARNVQAAIDGGFREITLSGINLGTWGRDLDAPETFSSLVEDLLELKGDFRLRISSINPMEIDPRLIDLMASHEKLCPHFHIPLQSGDDAVLARMRRNYNSLQYRRVVEQAVEKISGLGLGADVIVGFPGETDAQFTYTRKLIESLPFSYLHVFPYSPRPGTEAWSFREAVPKEIRKARNLELTELGRQKALAFRRQFIGRTLNVLVEINRDPASNQLKGHSENYISVAFDGEDSLMTRIVPVTLDSVSEHQVSGCTLSSP